MALSADNRPHFTTIAKFVSSMDTGITLLFRNVLMICSQEKLIGCQMCAIDQQGNVRKEKRAIDRLRSKVRRIDQWLAENKDKKGPSGNIIQSNVIDNESAKMPCAHGVVQGYNGVAAVDDKHQVIVCSEAFGSGSEHHLLRPMIEEIRKNISALGEAKDVLGRSILLADNGYSSEANARLVFEEGIEAYVPDSKYRKRNPSFSTANRHKRPVDRKGTSRRPKRFLVNDFKFAKTKNKLICPAGKEFYIRTKNFWTAKGWCGTSYMAKKTDCLPCKLRMKCLRYPTTVARQVTISNGKTTDGVKSFTQRMI